MVGRRNGQTGGTNDDDYDVWSEKQDAGKYG
jgi:hypothetical protein